MVVMLVHVCADARVVGICVAVCGCDDGTCVILEACVVGTCVAADGCDVSTCEDADARVVGTCVIPLKLVLSEPVLHQMVVM